MMRQFYIVVLLAVVICAQTLMAEDHTIRVQSSACGHPTEYTIPDGAPLTLIATPSYGYQFTQWSDGNTDNPRLLTVSADATYTAEFESISGTAPTICTITTKSEECGTPHTQQIPQGLSLTLVATPNDGSRFKQWSDGNTTNPRVLTVSGDATYIAEFESAGSSGSGLTRHAITASAKDCASPLVRSFIDGSTLTLHAVPNGDCGTFLRWSDGNTDNPRTVTVTGDATYTAVFEQLTYTITFNANGGATSVANKTVTNGSPYGDLPVPTRTGYYFKGWYTAATDGTKITGTSTVSLTADQTLYAHWNAANYTITLDRQGAAIGSTSTTGTYGSALQNITIPVKNGYVFEGYYTEVNGGGTKYYNSDGTGAKIWDIAAETKLYAYWTSVDYTISTSAINGTVSGGGTYTYNASATLTATPDDCYHFVKWSDVNTDNPRTVTVTSDATYTAIFDKVQYTITTAPDATTHGTTDAAEVE